MSDCNCADGDQGSSVLNNPDDSSLNHGLGDDDQVQSASQIDQELQFFKTERHLQNDDIFQDPIVPGQVPDLKEDVKLIAADEAAIEDLQFLMQDITRVRGMCQSFALEAERISPGVLKVPVGYFSKAPTSTRYKVATEQLFAKIWEFIKQAISKMREMLRKVIYWVMGKKEGAQAKPEDLKRENADATQHADAVAKETEKATDEVAAAAVNLSNAAKHGVELKEGQGTVQISSLDRIIGELLGGQNERVRKFMGGQDPIFNDLVNQGSYYKNLMQTNKAVLPAISALQEKVLLITRTINALTVANDNSEQVLQGEKLRKLQEPLYFHTQAGQTTVSAYLEQLRQQESEAAKPSQQMREFDEVFTALSAAFRTRLVYELNRFVDAGNAILIDTESALAEVETKLTGGDMQEHTTETNIDWHKTLHAVRTDITDLTALLMHVKAYRSQVTAMVANLMGFAFEVAEAIEKRLLPEQKNQQLTDTVQLLIKEARHYRETLSKLERL